MKAMIEIWNDKDCRYFPLLFQLWLLFLPFGSSILAIKLGPVTLYPSLILLLLLFIRFIWEFKRWNKWLKVFVVFLFLWILFAFIGRYWITPFGESDWKFDVRSLTVLWIIVSVLIGAFQLFGKIRFERLLTRGLASFLVVLIVFGVFEFYTGIHILGHFTDKMLLETEVRPYFYAPVFTYDNPNDFMAYFNGIILILGVLAVRKKHVNWLLLGAAILGLLFSLTAQSFFMTIVSTVLIIWFSFECFAAYWEIFRKYNYWMIPTALLLGILVYSRAKLFYGPKYSKGNYTVEGEYKHFPVPGKYFTSTDIRKNLFWNGVELIKESPFTGIGAGQFRYRHSIGSTKYETGTVLNAHNFLIEIVSQYGLVAWIFIGFLASGFLVTVRKVIGNWRRYYPVLLLYLLYPIFTVVPSGFLYLELNCLFVAVMMIMSFATEVVEVE
jgi:hypothetical protein